MDSQELVKHIVASYEQTYSPFLNDYTLSAIDLSKFPILEQNIDEIASLLMQCIQYQRGRTVKEAVRLSGNARLCTSFDEPSLKDWWHFLENLLKNLDLFKFNDEIIGQQLKTQLSNALMYGLKIQSEIVVANCVGKNFTKAKGLTIYLPETRIHSSVAKTKFVRKGNKWYDFLKIYLMP